MAITKPSGTSNKKRVIIRVIVSAAVVLSITGVSILALILLNGNPVSVPSESTNSLRSGVDETKQFDKGEAAVFGYFEVTVNEATPGYTAEDGTLPRTRGYEFLLLNVTAKNTDSTPHLLSDIDFGILSNKDVINASLTRVEPVLEFGVIEAGASTTGNILFEVPSDARDLKLYYNTQIYSEEQTKLRKIEYTLSF